jgi:mannose-6-phosphate isomerase-like protein (cupin superfamily)
VSPGTGTVVRAADVVAGNANAGVRVRTLLDTGGDEPGLVRRQIDLEPHAEFSGTAGAAGELWFVMAGIGHLAMTGHPRVALCADRGILLPPGSAYEVRAGEEGGLRLDAVSLPGPARPDQAGIPLSRDFGECEIETTGDRQFRVLFGPGHDCSAATQFVGEIPPGRAPDHSHPYDEVVLILAGEGLAHIGGAPHALSTGTCLHLPPGLRHCLENTGSDTLRVLGVFHPADSPAAKLEHHS